MNNTDLYSRETLPDELAEIAPIKKASERLEIMYLNAKEQQYYEVQQKRYMDELARIQEAVDKAVGEAVEKVVEKAVEEAVEKN